jgi:hypothetical protein
MKECQYTGQKEELQKDKQWIYPKKLHNGAKYKNKNIYQNKNIYKYC